MGNLSKYIFKDKIKVEDEIYIYIGKQILRIVNTGHQLLHQQRLKKLKIIIKNNWFELEKYCIDPPVKLINLKKSNISKTFI